MNVHIRVGLVVRHVVNNTVNTQRGAVGDAKTNAGQPAHTKVIGVAVVWRNGPALKLVAGARSTGTDDELTLTTEEPEREVVVQARRERMRVYVRRTDTACEFVALR
jgi:hypothetical protein